MSSRIQVLDEDIARLIAAGEVITRPAACIKELVDNSLDAGATKIHISVKDGGRRAIMVTDDGCGMTNEEAVLAFHRHATSKIRVAEDLDSVLTLGFRGEALPSMAAVSRLEIKTSRPGSVSGTNIRVEGGEIKRVRELSCPPGTTIEISSLFYNVPARLKFLKSVSTEMGCIMDIVVRYVLFYPSVSFHLEHNNHVIIRSPANGDPHEAALAALGRDVARALMPIRTTLSDKSNAISAKGFVARPSYNKSTNKYVYLAANGRQIRSRVMARAIFEAYKDFLPPRRYPLAIVDLFVPPRMMDVNVHPTKDEIRFVNEHEIFQVVYNSCLDALNSGDITPLITARKEISIGGEQGEKPGTYSERMAPGISPEELPFAFGRDNVGQEIHGQAPESGFDLSQSALSPNASSLQGGNGQKKSDGPTAFQGEKEEEQRDKSVLGLRPLAQLKRAFILCESPDGLYIIDQHAAHERVVYEKLLAQTSDLVPAAGLLFPITLSFSYSECVIIEQNLALLSRFGFGLERFGENDFIVKEIPAFLGNMAEKEAVEKTLGTLLSNIYVQDLDILRKEMLLQTACHNSVRAGDPLTEKEMWALLGDMAQLKNPYNCPHGRPTVIRITIEDLEKEFKRT